MIFLLSLLDSEEEKDKFRIIYNEYRNLMFHVANKILNNYHDAEDVVSESFTKVIEHFDSLSGPISRRTRLFLVTVTERTAIDYYRRKHRLSELPFNENEVNVPSADELEQIENATCIQKAMAMLPTRDREILFLKYYVGLGDDAIGSLMNMKKENVRKTIQRAKVKLARIMEEMENEGNNR